jgi:hypothetical protein
MEKGQAGKGMLQFVTVPDYTEFAPNTPQNPVKWALSLLQVVANAQKSGVKLALLP